MANEFIIKNGFHSKGDSEITGSLEVSGSNTNFILNSTDSKFTDSRATTKGIEYNADYSSNFTSRSLVDKDYVDNNITNNITASAGSGLIYNTASNAIDLGGALTENTVITGSQKRINWGYWDGNDSSYATKPLSRFDIAASSRILNLIMQTSGGYVGQLSDRSSHHHIEKFGDTSGVNLGFNPTTGMSTYLHSNLDDKFGQIKEVFETSGSNARSYYKNYFDEFLWQVYDSNSYKTELKANRTLFSATVFNSTGAGSGMFFVRTNGINLTDEFGQGITSVPNGTIVGNFANSYLYIESGSNDTKFNDGTVNKRGIKYKGFGETNTETGAGANYNTLVGTSLVPKKYLEDYVAASGSADTIYTADGALTGNRTVDLDGNSFEFTSSAAHNTTPINFEFGEYWQGFTRWDNTGAVKIKSNGSTDPLRVYKKVDSTNPNFVSRHVGGGHLGTDGNAWTVSQTYGSTTATRMELNHDGIKQYHGSGLQHSNIMGGAGSGVKFWVGGFSSLGDFIVGGSALISTEDISLQGDTLISKKLELSTTTDGMLMPRLTTAQMNAISSPDTHLLIFNTDLNALYRYNGSTWVAMAAGYGVVGVVRDSDNGNPTFYSDLQSALDTCKTAGSYNTVTLYGNVTTTSGIIIDTTFDYKNLTINFNGFKIENTQADATHCLTVGGLIAGTTTVLLDGNLIRENGTTGKCLQYDGTGTRNLQMSKMYFYNENYMTFQIGSNLEDIYDFGGSIFESGPNATINTVRLSYSNFRNFTVIGRSSQTALFLTNTAKASGFTVLAKGTGNGITTQTGIFATSFYVESNSGSAISGGELSNFVAKSVSGIAVSGPNSAHDFVATTGNNYAITMGVAEISNFRAENNSSTLPCINLTNTLQCVQGYVRNRGSYYAINVFRNQTLRSFSYNRITAVSEGGIAANLSSNPGFKILFSHCEFVSKWNDVGGHSVRIGGNDTILTNCSLRVNNVGANNLYAPSAITAKVANSTFDGATTPINSNVTLSNTNTMDDFGNILIG